MVHTFIVVPRSTWSAPELSEEGVGHWLEKRQGCEPRNIHDEFRDYPVALGNPDAAPAMRKLVASGWCLVSGPRRAADADAALFFGGITDGRFDTTTLDPLYVPISAKTLSWYVRENGVLDEKLRRTAVEYMTLRAPLFPGLLRGSEVFSLFAGLKRQTQHVGVEFEDLAPDPLLSRLGVALDIHPGDINRLRQSALEFALASASDPGRDNQAMVDDFFRTLEANGNLELARRLLADNRFKPSEYLSAYVSAAYARGREDSDRAMDAYFQRLEATLFPDSELSDDARIDALRILGRAAESIANIDFPRQWPRLRRILTEPLAYSPFKETIERSHHAGEAAHRDMLGLIDAAAGAEAGEPLGKEKLVGRIFALRAICRMGPEGRSLVPELERRLADGTIPRESRDWVFASTTVRAISGDSIYLGAYNTSRRDDPRFLRHC